MSATCNPVVTVVMPAHNAAEYIADSVHSVLSQTFEDFELIICNDGSTDATCAAVKSLCDLDSRIVFIDSEVSEGAGAARNKCLDASLGKYIAFLDADDMWQTTKLEKQIAYLEEMNADFVFSYYRTFQEHPDTKGDSRIIDSHWTGKILYEDHLWKKVNLGCLTVLCKSSLIQNKRMTNIRSGQDYAFWLDLFRSTNKAYCLPEVTAYYRTGHSSLSANKLKKISNVYRIFRHQESRTVIASLILCVNYMIMTVVLIAKSKAATKVSIDSH